MAQQFGRHTSLDMNAVCGIQSGCKPSRSHMAQQFSALTGCRGPGHVAYLGQLKDTERRGVKRIAEGKKKTPYQQLQLFDHNAQLEPEWVEVDAANVRVENELDFGGPWLALELMGTLHLDKLFESVMPRGGEDIPWAKMASVLAICRLCNPSSELFIAEHYYRSTAMPELLGIPVDKINEQRLYRALDKLLPHKEALETHLKKRLGSLFDLEYDLLLYDVTSTYFEGQCESNPMAQRGYSRDNRSDCKQVCIGLVVSKCGMPLGYEVFEGNRNDIGLIVSINRLPLRKSPQCASVPNVGDPLAMATGSR
jgi:hypothetical protein